MAIVFHHGLGSALTHMRGTNFVRGAVTEYYELRYALTTGQHRLSHLLDTKLYYTHRICE